MNKHRVLYIDDEEVNLTLFKLNLGARYDVILANSGIEGLQILKKNKDIEVVISDMMMPNMNGIEFVRKAKADNSDIAYYILTGYGLTPELNKAVNEGLILGCLSKPFEMREIDKKIIEALGK